MRGAIHASTTAGASIEIRRALAVRMVEKRIKRAEEDGRDPVILVRLAERIHAQLARERLAWEGVTDGKRT